MFGLQTQQMDGSQWPKHAAAHVRTTGPRLVIEALVTKGAAMPCAKIQ